MRNIQAWKVNNFVVVQQDIKINDARPFVDGLLATYHILYELQSIQQLDRFKISLNLDEVSAT